MIRLKTEEEIKSMKEGGKILISILAELKKRTKPGISSLELNKFAEELIAKYQAKPSFKGYTTSENKFPFPTALCVSLNEEIVHGIPSENKIIKENDLVSLDLGIQFKGLFTDAAVSFFVGNPPLKIKKLIDVTKKALDIGIKKAFPGNKIGDISWAVQKFIEGSGFSVIKNLCGHGVGFQVHEEPLVCNIGSPNTGEEIKVGMTFTIEPMVSLGSGEIKILENGWTAITKDRSLSCHFEKTIAITSRGPLILT